MRSSMGPTPASSLPQKLLANERETEGGSAAAAPPMAPMCVAAVEVVRGVKGAQVSDAQKKRQVEY